ncbi:unnamed protein product [Brachionus calyciflorus]|uniref:Uncharacterized protein n=1 Tax=Brachionus calyciflorus TaxID=104777 RepID=A0A813ZKL1_9BILA|nr:unnamed protein product [Brachionus calyciflorus]
MNKSLKSIENNEIVIKDSNKQKPKQLTLFDMKSKGKFPIKSDGENSPDLNRTKNKTDLKKSQNENDDIIMLDDEDENVENKKTPKSKNKIKSTIKDCKVVLPKIDGFFTKTSNDTNEQLNSKLSDLKIENEEDTKNTSKKAKTRTKTTEAKKISPKKIKSIRNLIKENGKLAFENLDSKLENHMFGDLASIIELYNSVVEIYDENKNRRLKKKKRSSHKDLDVYKIDLNEFIDAFDQDSESGRVYFAKIIRSLLKIFILHERIFGVRFPFCYDFTVLEYDTCFLQELTKYVLNILLPQINFQENDSELDMLYSQEKMSKHFSILKELDIDRSERPFGDMSMESKILLLKTFCDNLLFTGRFENHLQKLEQNLEKSKSKLKEHEVTLIDFLNIKDAEFNKSKAKYIKEAEKLNKPSANKVIESIEKIKVKIQNETDTLERYNRLEPIGRDTNNNCFWKFSFIKGVVVEFMPETDSEKSEWYLIDQPKNIQVIIDFMKKGLISPDLCKSLSTLCESLYEEERKLAEEQEKNHTKKKKEEETIKIDSCSEETEPEPRRYSLRRKTNEVTTQSSESEKESSEDELTKKYLEKLDSKQKKNYYERLAQVVTRFDWIKFEDSTYSIDTLWKYLVEQTAKINYYGFACSQKYKEIKQILRSYQDVNDFMAKFEIIKKVLCEFDELVISIFSKYLLLKNGKTLPNGVKLFQEIKNYLTNCESLSALYLMCYFCMNSVKWSSFRYMKNCLECNEKYDKSSLEEYIAIENLEKEDNDEFCGYFNCFRCYMPVHKTCANSNRKENDENEKIYYNCKACVDKRKCFDYVTENDEDKQVEVINEDLDEETVGGKKLRARKQVNYKENIKGNANDSDSESVKSSRSTRVSRKSLSASNSNSSISSLTKFNYEPKNRYSTRKTRKSEEIPQRSSARLRSSQAKTYVDRSSDEE